MGPYPTGPVPLPSVHRWRRDAEGMGVPMNRTGIDTEEPDEEPEEIGRWLEEGFDRETAETWRQWRFSISKARAWRESGIEEGIEAAQWKTAGATPDSVGDWLGAEIDAGEAVHWHEYGFSLEQARVHKQHGRGPAEAFRVLNPPVQNVVQGRVGGWVARGPMSSAQILPARLGGMVPGGPLQRFHQSGADPRLMHGYLQCGWIDDDAVEWARQGIEAHDAYTWSDLGLKAVEAGRLVLQGRTPGDVVHEWWSTGIPFEEVAEWIGAGLSAAEALGQRTQGITAEHAASLRALRLEEPDDQPRDPVPHALLARMGPPRAQVFGPPPEDEAAARAAVEDAYANMMTADDTGNVSTVDGGSNLGACLEEARDRHRVRVDDDMPGATVTVDMLRFVNDHEARVLFTINVGPPLNQSFGGRMGRAVFIDGEWKVARETFCEFMGMAGVQCPPHPDESRR